MLSVGRIETAQTFATLRKIDKDLVKELQTNLKTELSPVAKAVAQKFPSTPIVSGFGREYGSSTNKRVVRKLASGKGNSYVWKWEKVTGTVKVTPGKTNKGAGRNNVVSLSMNYSGATPYMFDMFGWKNRGSTVQAQRLYETIQMKIPGWSKGGRIFYKEFVKYRNVVETAAEKTLDRWSQKVSEELK